MATTTSEMETAEKAYNLAEEHFLAKDIAGALRAAREAHRLCPSLPGLINAVAAYKIHAAAASSRVKLTGWNLSWYAVLAVGGEHRSPTTSVTHESLKRQCRRLSLLVHPDKNHSAAADGAFKLIREAWDALSDRL